MKNLNTSNHSANKKNNNNNYIFNNENNNNIKSSQNSNRNYNNHSIGKNINLTSKGNIIKNNISNYNGFSYKQIGNNQNKMYNNIYINNINNINSLNNINNINNIRNNINITNNFNNLNNIKNFNAMNNMNNFNKNYIDFNNINNMKNINNSKFKRVNDQKSLPKKIPNENIQYNRIINNKRYESKREESIELMDKKINSTNNNMNYKLNKDYSYEPINKILFNKIITNKSVNKNERSNRKNIINIPQNNFIRTSNFNKIPDINDLNKFKNEDGKISMNTFMNQMIQRNSLQSKSQEIS